MTRTEHFSYPSPAFPVYTAAFASDRDVVLGGGGGASRSGVTNKLKLARIDVKAKTLTVLDEHELAAGEDAPASSAFNSHSKELVTGVTAAPSQLAQGNNENCRVFDLTDDHLNLRAMRNTFQAQYLPTEDYPFQKLTAFSRDGSLLGIGTSHNHLAILSYPSLDPAFQPTSFLNVKPGDLYDLDFSDSGTLAVATTSTTLHVYSIPPPSEKKPSSTTPLPLNELLTIERSAIKVQAGLTFRAARFGRGPTSTTLFAVLNAPPPKKKGEARKAYICSWDAQETKDGWKLNRCKVLAGKPITALDISDSGALIAYGCSDLSVGIIDSTSFAPLLKILRCHELPPTALKFNPSADLLLSASVDNTVRVITVPSDFAATYSTPVALLFLTLFLAFLAVLWQAHQSGAF